MDKPKMLAIGILGGGGASTPSTILDGLIAYWKLDESSNGSVPVQRNDSAGVNHLSDTLQASSTTGILSNGLVVAPSKEISIADNASLSMGSGVSFEFWGWVKITTGLAAFQEIYVVNKNGASSEYVIYLYKPDANTYLQAALRKADNSGSTALVASTYGNVATGSFIFFNVYHDAVNDLSGISINNGAFNTVANTFDVRDSNNAFKIGGASAGAGRAVADEIGVVKGRILTAIERTTLYNAGAGKTYPF